jgi:hypothetical protein
MAQLRIRIELQRPSKGIEMSKLERVSREAQKFLRSLGDDLRIPDGTWIAQGFYDQGVGFDATYQASDVDELQVDQYLHTLSSVLTVGKDRNWAVPGVSAKTLLNSAALATVAGEGETIRIGIANGEPAIEWRPLIKSRAQAIVEYFDDAVTYRGMLQGVIHSLYKEADYFDLRDLSSRDLVKCFYEPVQYQDVYAALARKNAVVLVAGWITTKRSTRVITDLRVERLKATDPLVKADLESFFGSAPGWTGDLTTNDFLKSARERESDGE